MHVPPLPAGAARPRSLEALEVDVRALVDAGAVRRASVERAQIPIEMRLLLAAALENAVCTESTAARPALTCVSRSETNSPGAFASVSSCDAAAFRSLTASLNAPNSSSASCVSVASTVATAAARGGVKLCAVVPSSLVSTNETESAAASRWSNVSMR